MKTKKPKSQIMLVFAFCDWANELRDRHPDAVVGLIGPDHIEAIIAAAAFITSGGKSAEVKKSKKTKRTIR